MSALHPHDPADEPAGDSTGRGDRVAVILDELGISPKDRIAYQFLSDTLEMLVDRPTPLDLKIAANAVHEMREAFELFEPYRGIRKVTIFGSARTQPDDPKYLHTEKLAAQLAAEGWMVVTGAGPGIMEAGARGAGPDMALGVSIRLPFEAVANQFLAGTDRVVSMKYFFTRKLMLVKESSAFVCLPGGFGTLDETFELLTLTQTGKGMPVPIVFLDVAGDGFWRSVDRLVRDELLPRGLISAPDLDLYRITDSATAAVDEIKRFYANYDSIRMVGDDLVVRMKHPPTPTQLADLNREFAGLVESGDIRLADPTPIERRQDDGVSLARITFRFNQRGYAELRNLIDAVNTFVPPPSAEPSV